MSDQEFRQRVRRYTPQSLVSITAYAGSRFWNRSTWFRQNLLGVDRDPPIQPWALAAIARVSLLHGTDFNRDEAEYDGLLSCFDAYNAMRDPTLKHGGTDALSSFLLRIGSEQLSFQQSDFNDLSRTAALLNQTPPKEPLVTIVGDWDKELLGSSVTEYVGAAFLLHASTVSGNRGVFDLGWLDQSQFADITSEVPADTLRQVIVEQYATDRTGFKAIADEAQKRSQAPGAEFRRFGFNPLASRPVVSGLAETLLIPVPGLVLRKASPVGIYYAGLAKWGTRFTNDLGDLFESYVGRQLRLIPDARVEPEIAYGPDRERKLSVDWFVVCDDCVILIEAKSCGPTEAIRLGAPNATADLVRKLGHGIEQLNASAQLIRGREPGFEAIPDDRPLVGLVVTLEPFPTVNNPWTAAAFPTSDIPYLVASINEVENLVSITDESAATLLREHLADPEHVGWSLGSALVGHQYTENPILRQGWDSYPWSEDQSTGIPSGTLDAAELT